MGLTLQQHGHSHGGGSTHSHDNINVRAAFIHVVGDFLQSFGVFVAAVVIYYKVRWHQLLNKIYEFNSYLNSHVQFLITCHVFYSVLIGILFSERMDHNRSHLHFSFLSISNVYNICYYKRYFDCTNGRSS